MFFNQNKRKRLHKNRVQFPQDYLGDINMAAVPLFRDTNMAAVTSRENTLLYYVIKSALILAVMNAIFAIAYGSLKNSGLQRVMYS